MQSEITIETGRGAIRVTLPDTILEAYDDNGEPVMRDTTSMDAVAVYGELVTLLTAAGHFHQAKSQDSPAPQSGPLPPGMPVPMHCGRPTEFKESFVNPKTKKTVPAKYQCTNDDCPEKATTGYKWSIFVDKYIKEQGQ